jgi:hypothetical protein
MRNANQNHVDDSANIADNGIRRHSEVARGANDCEIKGKRNRRQTELRKEGRETVAAYPFQIGEIKDGLSDPKPSLFKGEMGYIKGQLQQRSDAVRYGRRLNALMQDENKGDIKDRIHHRAGNGRYHNNPGRSPVLNRIAA